MPVLQFSLFCSSFSLFVFLILLLSQFSGLLYISGRLATQRRHLLPQSFPFVCSDCPASFTPDPHLVGSHGETSCFIDRWHHTCKERMGGVCELCNVEGESVPRENAPVNSLWALPDNGVDIYRQHARRVPQGMRDWELRRCSWPLSKQRVDVRTLKKYPLPSAEVRND